MAYGEAPPPLRDAAMNLQETGYHLFPATLDRAAAGALLQSIKATRSFDAGLFLSQAEFEADPQYRGVNPKPGRNVLERFPDQLGFVEGSAQITEALSALLGDGYGVLDRKVVCGVPDSVLPDWIRTRILGNPVNNLGCFIRPEFRDITYFYGIDFHQDLIDYKEREADFVTLYVYLHAVGRSDAPLFLLEGSHQLGASVFPHDLARDGDAYWVYRNGPHGEARTRQVVLTGDAGFAAVWHACTLHGTQPDASDSERISLRYIFERRGGAPSALSRINAGLRGPLSLSDTRVDLARDGAAVLKQNAVIQA